MDALEFGVVLDFKLLLQIELRLGVKGTLPYHQNTSKT